MKLYASKIPPMASEIVHVLIEAGDIEAENPEEAEMDVQACLKEYLRLDREISDKAKEILEQRQLSYEQFGRTKRTLADERGFALGEEALTWMANQIQETFMQSPHIDEIYTDDVTLRKKLKDMLRKHLFVDEEMDEQVRRRIKNLQEGTQGWDVEYAKVLEQIKRKHGIDSN